jgi:hypothetical protein
MTPAMAAGVENRLWSLEELVERARGKGGDSRGAWEGREMSGWSPAEAIAMERRHIAKGEERIAVFERYAAELAEKGYESLLPSVNETLGILRHSVDLSWERLQDLESRYRKLPRAN